MIADEQVLAFAITVAHGFEIMGIAIIVIGAIAAGLRCGRGLLSRRGLSAANAPDPVAEFRKGLGRSILVGLELLVAADIIRTVSVEPQLENVLVLGLVVLIRTFLSFSLELEIEGRWPWQRKGPARDPDAPQP
jgi:uncharacterized membrane protein